MNIKCPYCKGVSESETLPEVGETLQCPYCSRTFRFGQEISKPTRIEIPMGLSGSRRSAATGESIAPQSTPVVQGRSVKRSNFVRTHSRTACETESGWLHDHLAIVFGIGGAVIVGLMVAVIVLLLRGDNGRVDVARNLESVEAPRQENVEVGAPVVKESPVVADNILKAEESTTGAVVKVEPHEAVPMPRSNEHTDKDGDSSAPDTKDDGDDFDSYGTDDESDPFGSDDVDDDEDPFGLGDNDKSGGVVKTVASSAENGALKQVKNGEEEKRPVTVPSNTKASASREEVKNEYAILKKEHAVLAGAISQLDMIPDPGRAVYSLSQLLEKYSLAKVYDKWSGKKWDEFSEVMLLEVGESDRKFRVPEHSPGEAETKLKAVSSTLDGLKKEVSKLGGKNGVRQFELKRQIDSTLNEIEDLKKKVDREIAKEKLAIEEVKERRTEAFVGIIASIKNRIEEDALKPLKVKLEASEKTYTMVIEDEKREAAEKRRMVEAAREAARKKMEPIYKKQKAWYNEQLDYNGLSESGFVMLIVDHGPAAFLSLYDAAGSLLTINKVPVDGNGRFQISWPPSMPKGFAQELLETRIAIYKFENPTWENDLKKARQRLLEEEKRRAEEEKKEKAYKASMPKKRKINPDLKRFKGPGSR